jgi:hypothetical protein
MSASSNIPASPAHGSVRQSASSGRGRLWICSGCGTVRIFSEEQRFDSKRLIQCEIAFHRKTTFGIAGPPIYCGGFLWPTTTMVDPLIPFEELNRVSRETFLARTEEQSAKPDAEGSANP